MNLVGVWRLVEYLVELEDGRTIEPWGDDFLGARARPRRELLPSWDLTSPEKPLKLNK